MGLVSKLNITFIIEGVFINLFSPILLLNVIALLVESSKNNLSIFNSINNMIFSGIAIFILFYVIKSFLSWNLEKEKNWSNSFTSKFESEIMKNSFNFIQIILFTMSFSFYSMILNSMGEKLYTLNLINFSISIVISILGMKILFSNIRHSIIYLEIVDFDILNPLVKTPFAFLNLKKNYLSYNVNYLFSYNRDELFDFIQNHDINDQFSVIFIEDSMTYVSKDNSYRHKNKFYILLRNRWLLKDFSMKGFYKIDMRNAVKMVGKAEKLENFE